MRFDQLFLDEIRERVPISNVIGMRVQWDAKKSNVSRGDHWACCPFHGEKSPSFHCEDRKGRYHCFGCGVTGDHFRFLVELDGLAFPEAVERVADMAGIALPAAAPRDEVKEKRRASLYDVAELAVTFFEQALQTQDGAKARAYLRDRGLSGRTQIEFRLGYGPESRNALKSFLAGKGIDKELIEGSGLVVFGDDIPVSYDRFRDRVMFPIEDTRGRPIAFGGRALSADVPAKYLNSPETELFSKGRTLYNFAKARKASQEAGTLIAVEGYMDVIALAQAGIHHAVAPLGTALTEDQLDMLFRATDEPVLSFDGDGAGLRAAYRAIDIALPKLKPGKSLRFALLPSGQDPDDVVRRDGKPAFDKLVAQARPLADMLWARETSVGTFDTPERRAELEGNLKRLTNLIADDTVKRHYAQDMRDRMQSFFGAARQGRDAAQNSRRASQSVVGGNRTGMAPQRTAMSDSLARSPMLASGDGASGLREAALIVAVVNHPHLGSIDIERFETLNFSSAAILGIRSVLLDVFSEAALPERNMVVQTLAAKGLGETFESLETRVRNAGLWTALEGAAYDDSALFFEQAAGLHRRIYAIRNELREAELELGDNATEERFAAFVTLSQELSQLQQIDALVEGFGVLSGRTKSV